MQHSDYEEAASATDSHKPNQPDEQTKQSRQEKKRITDRAAQRAHRMRQKQYVRELETQVATLKRHVSSGENLSLYEENARLRQEVQELKSVLVSIRSLTMRSTADMQAEHTARSGAAGLRRSSAFHRSPSATSNSPTEGQRNEPVQTSKALKQKRSDPHQGGPSAGPMFVGDDATTNLEALRSTLDLGHKHGAPHVSSYAPFLDNALDPRDAPSFPYYKQLGQSSRHQPQQPVHYSQATSESLDAMFAPLGPSFDQSSSGSLSTSDSISAELFPGDASALLLQTGSPDRFATLLPYSIFNGGLVQLDTCDQALHNVIQRAKRRKMLQSFRLPMPTVAEFALQRGTNTVADEVKRHIESLRGQTAEGYALFWIIYLFIRWQIDQDSESFEAVPKWLRPTSAQINIPHPITMDFLMWPAMRNKVIQLSQTDPGKAHEIVEAAAKCLQLNLDFARLTSLDDAALHETLSDICSWHLQPSFFEAFPELSEPYARSFDAPSNAKTI